MPTTIRPHASCKTKITWFPAVVLLPHVFIYASVSGSVMRYVTLFTMWRAVMVYTLGINTVLYLFVGLIAAILHARSVFRVILLTILSALLGVLTAVVLAAVPSLLLAALYKTVPSPMSAVEAIVLGCGQGLIIAMLNAGLFHRLL